MLVKDTEALKRDARQKKREQQASIIQEWARRQLTAAQALLTEDNITNPESRMGHPLTHQEFEARLKKLCPRLVFRDHPRLDMRCVYLLEDGGKLKFLSAYSRGIIPEYSIMSTRKVKIPTLFVYKHHIDKDEAEAVRHGEKPPWEIEVERPWEEIVRGWRTVLILLVLKGVLSIHQVESEFGTGTKDSWAIRLGKRKGRLHWEET